MEFVCDLHLHSKYSRAVSQQMTLPNMANWAKLKGINVLATGDFTHPFWFDALKVGLEEAGNGLYRQKSRESSLVIASEAKQSQNQIATSANGRTRNDIYFLLSAEISSIYSQGGKARRIHNLFMFPKLESVEKFNKELLKRRANLRSDGRPIVGIPSRELARIALEIDERALVIPAHAWTPWFSIFGSFSGFDSVEECFGDMAKYIYGIETGLSSDPVMNWQIADLDRRSILSFSDAHSLEKMGREATVFEAQELSYDSIYSAIAGSAIGAVVDLPDSRVSKRKRPAVNLAVDLGYAPPHQSGEGSSSGNAAHGQTSPRQMSAAALQSSPRAKIAFTIEFYPEEGKYHFTGHRNCNYSQGPEVDKSRPCPACGRSLTVGVMDRVEELKTRDKQQEIRDKDGVKWIYSNKGRPPYVNLVPLGEILAEALGVGTGTQKVKDVYMALVTNLGSEFGVLMRASVQDIARLAGARAAEAVAKVRHGDIVVEPGYDGQFGIVKIWPDGKGDKVEEEDTKSQLNLFA